MDHRYDALVRTHHAFAGSGGTGRVKQSRRIVLVDSFPDLCFTRLLLQHFPQSSQDFSVFNGGGDGLFVVEEYDRESRLGEFGDELTSRESEYRFRIGDLLGDFSCGVKRIRGGYYGTEGHDGQTHHGEVDRVWREEEDDVAFPYAKL